MFSHCCSAAVYPVPVVPPPPVDGGPVEDVEDEEEDGEDTEEDQVSPAEPVRPGEGEGVAKVTKLGSISKILQWPVFL